MWRRQKWRREWITRFAERQRIAKRWIALIDLVDWCAQSTTAASDDDEMKAREVAYRRLAESMRRGEFEHDGRSKLLYLDTLITSDGAAPCCRLTREQFEIAFDLAATPPAPSLPLTVLNCCWLPRELARRWLESHGYRWSPHFEPTRETRSVRADEFAGAKKPRPVPPSREKPFWPAARAAAIEWLTENGCPAPGDGNQADLERWVAEWLEVHGHGASEPTVRRHVSRWIQERRAELNS